VFNSPQVFPISCRGSSERPRGLLPYSSSPSSSLRHLLTPAPPPHPVYVSLSLSSRLSVYPCRSVRLLSVASSQSSFMPPGGEDLITHGEWIRPVRPSALPPSLRPGVAGGSRRCLKFSWPETSPLLLDTPLSRRRYASITCSLF